MFLHINTKIIYFLFVSEKNPTSCKLPLTYFLLLFFSDIMYEMWLFSRHKIHLNISGLTMCFGLYSSSNPLWSLRETKFTNHTGPCSLCHLHLNKSRGDYFHTYWGMSSILDPESVFFRHCLLFVFVFGSFVIICCLYFIFLNLLSVFLSLSFVIISLHVYFH